MFIFALLATASAQAQFAAETKAAEPPGRKPRRRKPQAATVRPWIIAALSAQ